MCDKVCFLARGGYLGFYGPPEEALAYFGVNDFDEIYEKLDNVDSPEEWAKRFLASQQIQEYVVKPLTEVSQGGAAPAGAGGPAPPPSRVRQASGWNQFLILCQRYLTLVAARPQDAAPAPGARALAGAARLRHLEEDDARPGARRRRLRHVHGVHVVHHGDAGRHARLGARDRQGEGDLQARAHGVAQAVPLRGLQGRRGRPVRHLQRLHPVPVQGRSPSTTAS